MSHSINAATEGDRETRRIHPSAVASESPATREATKYLRTYKTASASPSHHKPQRSKPRQKKTFEGSAYPQTRSPASIGRASKPAMSLGVPPLLKSSTPKHHHHRQTAHQKSTKHHDTTSTSFPLLTLRLHLLSFISSCISLTASSLAIRAFNANFFHTRGPNRGDWTDGAILAPLSVSALHSFTVIVSACRPHARPRNPPYDIESANAPHQRHHHRRRHHHHRQRPSQQTNHNPTPSIPTRHHRGSHLLPLLPILLNFVITLSLLALLILAIRGGLFNAWHPTVLSPITGEVRCDDGLNVLSRVCLPEIYTVGELQIGGIVAGVVVLVCRVGLLGLEWRSFKKEGGRDGVGMERFHGEL